MLKLPRILVVEDDEIDILNMERVFRRNNVLNALEFARNGVEALSKLESVEFRRSGPLAVIMDLNMPKMGGLELLRRIRQNPELNGIPVVVFSTSDEAEDLAEAFRYHPTAYFVKALAQERFQEDILAVLHFINLSRQPRC
ncbi:response regulator [bacterium]|nr:response regulator [bacterium]